MRRSKPTPTSRPEDAGEVLLCDLSLYVAGSGPRSRRAIDTVKRVCEKQFPGRYRLRVVDIYQQPAEARAGQIIAVPTLVRQQPAPKRMFIGDVGGEDDLSGRLRGSGDLL